MALIVATSGRDNPASVETIAEPDLLPDAAVVGINPDTGGSGGAESVPRGSGRTGERNPGGSTELTATPPLGGPAGRVDSALVPDGYRIGYRYTDADAPSAVVLTRYDFSDERVVFTAPPGANYTAADWSPARDRILIGYCINQSPCSVRTVTPDGVVSAVLDNGRRPTWSPDGRWILTLKPGDNSRDELWVLPSTGGTPVKIGESGSACCGPDPEWSPDSTRIAWPDPQRQVLRIAGRDATGAQTLRDPKDLLQHISGTKLRWSPSSDHLLVERLVRDSHAPPSEAKLLAAVVNVEARRWQELGEWSTIDWVPGGQSVIVQRPKSGPQDGDCTANREIAVLTISDGSLRGLGGGCSARLSPDRALLAIAEVERARVVELASTDHDGRVVYVSDGGFRSRSSHLLCCAWTPGNDALVLTDADLVVARVDGRARWQHPRR